MNKMGTILIAFIAILLLGACRNKTVELISKKWDCVQVENIVPPDAKFHSSQDSLEAVQLQSLLQSISWIFNNNLTYECKINNTVTVRGSYELNELDKTLVLTPDTRNNINRYFINTLNENELVLTGSAENKKLTLHFMPH